MKTCLRCEADKPITEFYPDKKRYDGVFPYCKTCNAELCRAYRQKNAEKLRAKDREKYHADTARKKAVIEATRRRREKNPGLRREEYKRDFAKNPEKYRNWNRAREARKRGAERVEKIDREYIIARDSGICHLCGKKPPRHLIELDHLVPLSKGGNHTADNLRVSCRRCNRVRNDGRLPAQLLLVG